MGRTISEINQLYRWHAAALKFTDKSNDMLQPDSYYHMINGMVDWLIKHRGAWTERDTQLFFPYELSHMSEHEQIVALQQLSLMKLMKIEMYRRCDFISECFRRAACSSGDTPSIDAIRWTSNKLSSQIDTFYHSVETCSAFVKNTPVNTHYYSTSLDSGAQLVYLSYHSDRDLRKTIQHFKFNVSTYILSIAIRSFPTIAITLVVILLNAQDYWCAINQSEIMLYAALVF